MIQTTNLTDVCTNIRIHIFWLNRDGHLDQVLIELRPQELLSSTLKEVNIWGVAKLVRHKVLILACAGSSPATPAKYFPFINSGTISGGAKDIFR